MKKHVLTLFAIVALGFSSFAQTITITLTNANNNFQPITDQLVFFFNNSARLYPNGVFADMDLSYPHSTVYTNSSGQITVNAAGIATSDTVYAVTQNCNGTYETWGQVYGSINGPQSFPIACAAGPCQDHIDVDYGYDAQTGDTVGVWFTSHSYRKDAIINPGEHVNHVWVFGNATRNHGTGWSPDNDTAVFSIDTAGPEYVYMSYQRYDSSCAGSATWDSIYVGGSGRGTVNPTPHNCAANYFVDTVNSGNFQGQLIIGEASTSDGVIADWIWDFGDGSAPVYAQYPSHTYSNYGSYNVCLTIVSYLASATSIDTCVSTFCNVIGMDSLGNLIYKNASDGFTINVVDPATFSVNEIDITEAVSLFPNPSNGNAQLTWPKDISVASVTVLSVNGQLIKELSPSSNTVQLEGLSSGIYIVKIDSDEGQATKKLIVQ